MTNVLYAKGLITKETNIEMHSKMTGKNELERAGILLIAVQGHLEASTSPNQYLINFCYILLSQKCDSLTEITVPILKQLGECVYAID